MMKICKSISRMKLLPYALIGAVFNPFPLSVWAQGNPGNCNVLIGKARVVPSGVSCSLGNRNRIAAITISQPILVLNKIEDLANPMSDALKQENQMGLV